jgi:hypothetical protein
MSSHAHHALAVKYTHFDRFSQEEKTGKAFPRLFSNNNGRCQIPAAVVASDPLSWVPFLQGAAWAATGCGGTGILTFRIRCGDFHRPFAYVEQTQCQHFPTQAYIYKPLSYSDLCIL